MAGSIEESLARCTLSSYSKFLSADSCVASIRVRGWDPSTASRIVCKSVPVPPPRALLYLNISPSHCLSTQDLEIPIRVHCAPIPTACLSHSLFLLSASLCVCSGFGKRDHHLLVRPKVAPLLVAVHGQIPILSHQHPLPHPSSKLLCALPLPLPSGSQAHHSCTRSDQAQDNAPRKQPLPKAGDPLGRAMLLARAVGGVRHFPMCSASRTPDDRPGDPQYCRNT